MKVLHIGLTGLRRLLRDRANIFFVFILPVAIILLVGAQFGSGAGPVGVVSHGDGDLTSAVLDRLDGQGVSVQSVDDEATVIDRVERGAAGFGIVIPPDFDESVQAGEQVTVGFVSRPDSLGSLAPVLDAALAEVTADYRVGQVVSGQAETDLGTAVEALGSIEAAGIEVQSETVGEALFGSNVGQFSIGASQMLVMFVFLTSLTGSAALIQSRQLGVTSRMLSTPTGPGTIITGEGMARFFVGLFQGIYIVVMSLFIFGVEWGDALGWVPLLLALSATGAGAAMLFGSLFQNDQQAGGFSVMAGIGLAALGGCMLPLELFSPTMTTVAHITPHAWANDGFADLIYRGGSAVDVLPEVGVLLLYALVLFGIAAWRLRAAITRP